MEFSGTVEAVGAGATRWSPGDAVMGIVGGGAYAEFVVTHEDLLEFATQLQSEVRRPHLLFDELRSSLA